MNGRRLRWLGLMILPLVGACQAALFGVVNIRSGNVAAITRTYASDPVRELDIYRPSAVSVPAPVALFFYGGSWRDGSRSEYAFVGQALAAQGVLTVVADYRKYPPVRFPDFEVDAAKAARWTIDHVSDLGGDPRRVFIVGHSAGAQIAALLGSDAHYLSAEGLKPRDFAGVIGIAGPYDFLPLTDPKLIEVFGDKSQWPASQPINFVDGDEPPFLLLQGDGDRVVNPGNSQRMAAKLREAGVGVTYKRYPDIGHFRILAGLRYTSLAPTLADIVAFISQPRRGVH